jgi:hypothetical protein
LPVEEGHDASVLLSVSAVVRSPIGQDRSLAGDPQRLVRPSHQEQERGKGAARFIAIGVPNVCGARGSMARHFAQRRQRLGEAACPHVEICELEPWVTIPREAALRCFHEQPLRLIEAKDRPRSLREVPEVDRGCTAEVAATVVHRLGANLVTLDVVARLELDRAKRVLRAFYLVGVAGRQALFGREPSFLKFPLLHERPCELGLELRGVELVVAIHETKLFVVVL